MATGLIGLGDRLTTPPPMRRPREPGRARGPSRGSGDPDSEQEPGRCAAARSRCGQVPRFQQLAARNTRRMARAGTARAAERQPPFRFGTRCPGPGSSTADTERTSGVDEPPPRGEPRSRRHAGPCVLRRARHCRKRRAEAEPTGPLGCLDPPPGRQPAQRLIEGDEAANVTAPKAPVSRAGRAPATRLGVYPDGLVAYTEAFR